MAEATAPSAIDISPQPGQQTAFLSSTADVVVYGGAAGGGKSWGLLLEPLRHIDKAQFNCVIFRRTYAQVTNPGGLWDQSMKLYSSIEGARGKGGNLEWSFPSGARVKFGNLQHAGDEYNYQGSEIALICFDELTHFEEAQFWYLFSRNRSLSGTRPYIRASTNPDADSWVAKLIEWWIDPDTGYPIPQRAGRLRYFARVADVVEWADTPEELTARFPHLPITPKSFTFIPAKLSDNRKLMEADPGYLANLMALPLVERERLLGGNWKIRPDAGKVFNRSWFDIVPEAPSRGLACLFWDLASTEKELAADDPSFTAAVLMQMTDGAFYVRDCLAFQGGPAEVEQRFLSHTALVQQQMRALNIPLIVRWEVEPGSAGRREAARFVKMLRGIDAGGIPAEGDKLVRARPLAAQAQVRNVLLAAGEWNERWLSHMHAVPTGAHMDIMDASSGAFNVLVAGPTRRATSKEYGSKTPQQRRRRGR
jgi:predicted phage terminase large subunit-like protein